MLANLDWFVRFLFLLAVVVEINNMGLKVFFQPMRFIGSADACSLDI